MPAPRWFSALEQAVNQNSNSSRKYFPWSPQSSIAAHPFPVFQLATVDSAGKPHARSVIHRAFLVPPANPAHPLLVTSTDIRTPKAQQINYSDTVEVAWWINATQDQFRILGRARVFGAPERNELPVSLPSAASDYTGFAALEAPGFDWEAKRRELFDAVSESMRATWCRPPPGSPLKGGYEEMDDWPAKLPKPSEAKTNEEKKLVEIALSNYAIIAIEPLEVDWLQMSIKPNRRTFFTLDGDDWKDQPIVP
ncbi:pyridoxamine 5'-phosphate oxidase-domain-containing protein [Gloeopeniophorella convolvens]|nr:pyridoxamine 5'-phosphate oxidase-domain-containing protein [Gloeopeniophorella convolvens]